MNIIFLGLGSNSGDREENLRLSVRLLEDEVRVVKVSSIYESDPVGVLDQPAFLNLVLQGETEFLPAELLVAAKEVEREVGRVPTYRWGPRVIDVDILLYGNENIADPDLVIPHPEMLNRAFVLVPLCEIAPHLRLPNQETPCSLKDQPAIAAQAIRRMGSLGITCIRHN